MDITVHEKQTDGRLREVFTANGGAIGALMVEEAYIHVYEDIVGKEVFQKCITENPYDHIDFLWDFELTKRRNTSCSVTLKLPKEYCEFFKQHNGKSLTEAVKDSIYRDKLSVRGNKVCFDPELFESLFEPYCDSIINHVTLLFSQQSLKDVKNILMVGGPSENEIVQNAMKRSFPNVKIVVPPGAHTAVFKGAVLFGHRPQIISSRISKYSYGLSISPLFDRNIHSNSRRVFIDGATRCRDVFMKFLARGDTVRIGDTRTWELSSIHKNQEKIVIKLYISSEPNPMYVDEEGAEFLGYIVVEVPTSGNNTTHVRVRMMFGDTELIVEATEMSTQKKFSAYFDCL